MSKQKTPEPMIPLAQSLESLKEKQTLHVPGTHPLPFLSDPADFVSGRTVEELAASQQGQLIALPKPKRSPPVLDLAEVIGSQQADGIQQSGQIVFHAAGDTGAGKHEDLGQVVRVMAMDYHRPNPADRPGFFLHLGDVIYNLLFGEVESKSKMYLPQFYRSYEEYPGKILAIPGNHDSDPEEDPKSIDAFEENFCALPPQSQQELMHLLQTPKRSAMYQPGVYYRLDAPFVQIIALFSNGGEQEGVIRGGIVGDDQWTFLLEQLKEIKRTRDHGTRKVLLIAVHHPPFSGGGGHAGSGHMLQDLDAAFKAAAIQPDAILSGHAHNYQRFTREITFNGTTVQVPYVVAGCGGHNITPLKPRSDRKPVKTPLRGKLVAPGQSDNSLRQYFNGYGHLLITASKQVLTIDLIGTKTETSVPVDSVTVDLASQGITDETAPFDHPANGEQETMHNQRPPRRLFAESD
jgi:Calcineurin-like phosphoesterase